MPAGQSVTILWLGEVDIGSLSDDPRGVDAGVGPVTVCFDMCQVDGFRDPRELVKFPGVVRQVRVIGDSDTYDTFWLSAEAISNPYRPIWVMSSWRRLSNLKFKNDGYFGVDEAWS